MNEGNVTECDILNLAKDFDFVDRSILSSKLEYYFFFESLNVL